jgi:hypothetical protein
MILTNVILLNPKKRVFFKLNGLNSKLLKIKIMEKSQLAELVNYMYIITNNEYSNPFKFKIIQYFGIYLQ